jgi:PPM family protein phosphatase
MRHPTNVEIGVATHTGRVRRVNEDDYLLCAPQDVADRHRMGWIVAIADGMGGAAGGAEASRTAVRAAIRPFLDSTATNGASDPAARMRDGFASAVAEVFELSQENSTLRGMGTTLTIVNLLGQRMVLGHVGDTRCLRIRKDVCTQLSEDHAVREPDNYLTRCIGAGQRVVEADITEFDVEDGDRFVLMTDGLWAVVPAADIQEIAEAIAPQDAANELVRLANSNGGPDNSTVIIVHVLSTRDDSRDQESLVDVDLPAEELAQPPLMLPPGRDLIPARWPWVLLAMGVVLFVLGLAKILFDIDVFAWVVSRFP